MALVACGPPDRCREEYGCLAYDRAAARTILVECVGPASAGADSRVTDCMTSAIELSCTRYGFAHVQGGPGDPVIWYRANGIRLGFWGEGAEGRCPDAD